MTNFSKPHGVVSEIDHDIKLLKHKVPGLGRFDETGWSRLCQMYSWNHGRLSPELNIVVTTSSLSGLMGFLTGGLNYAKQARENFVRQNNHNKFFDGKDYQRKLLDQQFVQATRGGLKMAWRTSLFSGIYMLGVISGSVYREKFGIFEHVLAGGLTAAIYRSHLGLRGMWFGTILGMVFGTIGGTICFCATRILNVSLAEARYDYYKYYVNIWDEEARQELNRIAAKVLKEEREEATKV
ncbi:RPII140-upstream gene protein-like [Varroa destructor]|uniref:Complex I assembly factor TIMMDC1, mitochondrial n=1 Tax=Varroa destructor TaxID=109461 RepID=A0A7M7M8G5_VARDE|nr:RPII140-upstream gene protein-like [Varroa destructor]